VKVRDGTYRGAGGGALARRARRAVGGVGAARRVELRAHRHEVALAVEQHGVLRGRAGEEGSQEHGAHHRLQIVCASAGPEQPELNAIGPLAL